MFNIQSAYLFKFTVRLSLQFPSVPLWASAQAGSTCTAHRHLCLYCWHLLWKEFRSLYFRFRLSDIIWRNEVVRINEVRL